MEKGIGTYWEDLPLQWREFIKFGIVGVFATIVHYGVYLLIYIYVPVNVAYTIGYIVSFLLNFALSSYFTFGVKPTIRKGIGFGMSHGVNYLLHMFFLNLFIWLGVGKEIAPFPVFLIVIPINFLLVRFVFKSTKI
ncbi:GtrA family protein [Parabacteroides acidifaciens]|uniref:GtrA family protein n=1 Tax=Parabacteroides acidifaciens TaxID=2290935 RepID=A0A3D8HIN0_9BACT|nr:GtrA family protein [Parabacteroides acidifaciens]MBC8600850.1 GtrA family protein [Parabacteroides acidifaciens]RDU50572.1 GtrA family protein [Parabacteroides acidifaciens]